MSFTLSSRLGFGCAHLPGRLSRSEALGLLEAAFDAGVTHFDVARMYGSGRAEALVGAFAQGKRDQITLVTKAGLAPPSRALHARAWRRALLHAPGLAASAPKMLQSLGQPKARQFAPAQIRASLETSLRELRVEQVDVLLLHECAPEDLSDDLLHTLHAFKRHGKIGAWGIAASPYETRAIVKARPDFCDIVQAAADAEIDSPPGRLILHSVLARQNDLSRRLNQEPALAASFARDVRVDPTDRATLARLCLQDALATHPQAIVLFSSANVAHIRSNAALMSGAHEPRLDAFRRYASSAG